MFVSLMLGINAFAQTTSSARAEVSQTSSSAKPKKVIFRATKDQIKEVQTKLKEAKRYSGEVTGTLDEAIRASIKNFQNDNGLKGTGTLNRATLEKMSIELTDRQKLIPVSDSSFAAAEVKTTSKSTMGGKIENTADSKPKKVIFRATKDQITEAQKMLKAKSMYSGEETGKLDDATRDGLKKFQGANDVKVTGTLNQITLEKMGIALTDKQKADAADINK